MTSHQYEANYIHTQQGVVGQVRLKLVSLCCGSVNQWVDVSIVNLCNKV